MSSQNTYSEGSTKRSKTPKKKKVLVKKKKAKPSDVTETSTNSPSRKVTTTTSFVEQPTGGGQQYFVEESDDSQIASGQHGSGGTVPKSYYVSTPSSDEDDERKQTMQNRYFQANEPYQSTGQGEPNGVEIVSVHDDTSEYTEEYEESEASMASDDKWKGKNLSYMTPAMMHALKMSQMQSQNKYKAKYNDEVRGKGFAAGESLDTQRARKMSSEQSLLKYHMDFETSKGKGFTAVSDTPEMLRIKKQQTYRDTEYKKEFLEQKGHNIPVVETPETVRVKQQQKFLSDIKYQEDRNKLKGKATQVTDDPSTIRAMEAAKIASNISYKKSKEKTEEMERRRQQMNAEQQNSKAYKRVNAPGSIMDYDPVAQMSASTKQMNIQERPKEESNIQSPTASEPEVISHPIQAQEEPKKEDIEVPSEQEGDGLQYRAMYDYTAQDEDEVSFMDGDIIINAQRIDDGWMFGTVKRTGQIGMLPSNYVEVQ